MPAAGSSVKVRLTTRLSWLAGFAVKRDQLDRDLLAAWLNFANGAVEWDELVDTNGNGTPDTAFRVAMQTAEAVRINPSSTPAQIDAQRAIIQRVIDTI